MEDREVSFDDGNNEEDERKRGEKDDESGSESTDSGKGCCVYIACLAHQVQSDLYRLLCPAFLPFGFLTFWVPYTPRSSIIKLLILS